MAFGLKRKPKVTLGVSVEPAGCLPGETITARVSIGDPDDQVAVSTPENEVSCGGIGLRYGTFQPKEARRGKGTVNELSQVTELGDGAPLHCDAQHSDQLVSLEVPADAVPTGPTTGLLVAVTEIERKGRSTLTDAQEIAVWAPRELHQDWAERPPESSFDGDRLALSFPDRNVRPGETLSGTVTLHGPLISQDARPENAIELSLGVLAMRRDVNLPETLEVMVTAGPFEVPSLGAGEHQDFPIAIVLPDELSPSTETEGERVSLHHALTVYVGTPESEEPISMEELEINVYTQPAPAETAA